MFLAASSSLLVLMGWVSSRSLNTVEEHSTSMLFIPYPTLVLQSPHQGLDFFHCNINFVSD